MVSIFLNKRKELHFFHCEGFGGVVLGFEKFVYCGHRYCTSKRGWKSCGVDRFVRSDTLRFSCGIGIEMSMSMVIARWSDILRLRLESWCTVRIAMQSGHRSLLKLKLRWSIAVGRSGWGALAQARCLWKEKRCAPQEYPRDNPQHNSGMTPAVRVRQSSSLEGLPACSLTILLGEWSSAWWRQAENTNPSPLTVPWQAGIRRLTAPVAGQWSCAADQSRESWSYQER